MATRKSSSKLAPVTPANDPADSDEPMHTVQLSPEERSDFCHAFNTLEYGARSIAALMKEGQELPYPLTNEDGVEIPIAVRAITLAMGIAAARVWTLVFPDPADEAARVAEEANRG